MSSSTLSALTELRSKQSTPPPLLHLDTIGLSGWDTSTVDSDDLAGLWNAFTKCKKVLSDGYRLENMTWRLWQREKILSSGVKIHSDDNHSPLFEPLDLFTHSPFKSSNTSPNPIYSAKLTPPTHSPQTTSSLHPFSSSDRSLNSPLNLSHILPPPRPNAITPVSLGVIIDTLLPMDIMAEQAHAKELLASSSTLVPTNTTASPSHLLQHHLTTTAQPANSSSTQSHLPTPPVSSNDLAPTHTPVRLKAPPRIVNIAPTPPPASPAVTAPTSPIMGPSHSDTATEPFANLQTLLKVTPLCVDPVPTNELGPIASGSSNRLSGVHARRPLSVKRYSSSSTTTSSVGFKSVATSPSIDERADSGKPTYFQKRLGGTKSIGHHRRANSSGGTKRKPLAYLRTVSSTRSVSPKLGARPLIEESISNDLKTVKPSPEIGSSSSSSSINSLRSPIIPVTPHNSQSSPPTLHSPIESKMPSAPPPTPAEHGAHLPTTMSAGIQKSNTNATAKVPALEPKKKAKFFINGYETEEEHLISPPTMGPNEQASLPPPPTAMRSMRHPEPPITEEVTVPKTNNEEQEDDDDDQSSDSWASSDSEVSTNDSIAEKEAEMERRKKQEEYHRQLFAKKHFAISTVTSGEPNRPIKRAGLSMLFHPELNHLDHHPNKPSTSSNTNNSSNKNSSAVDLRCKRISRASEPPPRPTGSLIKSKSTIAVPILVSSTSPPQMVQHQNLQPTRRKPPSEIEYSSDEEMENIAKPLSPRTTRRNMLANEMTESVRRNLLWERQMRSQTLGLIPSTSSNNNPNQQQQQQINQKQDNNNKVIENQTDNNNPVVKEYKHFSKGFHRSGW